MHSLALCGSINGTCVTGTAMISLSQTATEHMTRCHFLPTSSFQWLFKMPLLLSYFINGFPYRTKGKKFLSNCTLSGCSGRKMDRREKIIFSKKREQTHGTVSLQPPLRSPLQKYRPINYHSQPALEEPKAPQWKPTSMFSNIPAFGRDLCCPMWMLKGTTILSLRVQGKVQTFSNLK